MSKALYPGFIHHSYSPRESTEQKMPAEQGWNDDMSVVEKLHITLKLQAVYVPPPWTFPRASYFKTQYFFQQLLLSIN